MNQDFLKMMAQHKEGTLIENTPQNNENTQAAPTIQDGDETAEHEEDNVFEQTQPGSIVTVQRDADTHRTKNPSIVSKKLFNENTEQVPPSKAYITQQQLLNKSRSSKRR